MLKQAFLLGFGVALLAGAAQAQIQPGGPIQIVVGYNAGGSTDIMARLIGDKLSESLGQPVIVVNKPGAAGQIASANVARAAPDGHTILFTNMGPNAIAPSLNSQVQYDPVKDFAPIILAATMPLAITSSVTDDIKDIKGLIAVAKANPDTLTYGSTGVGSATHVAGELFKLQSGITATHVPYKGGAQVGPATSTGEVSYSFQALPDAMSLVNAGRLEILALTSAERSKLAPDLPTVRESGLADFDVDVWYGFLAPAQTPQPVIERLNRELGEVLALPDVHAKLIALSMVPQHTTPEAFQRIIRDDVERWRKVVADAGIESQ